MTTTIDNKPPGFRPPTSADRSVVGSNAGDGGGRRGKKTGTGWGWLVLCMVMGLVMGLLIAGGGMYVLFAKFVIPGMIQGFQEAAQKPPEPTLVRVDPVTQQTVADLRLVTGYIQPVRQSDIASEESGRVMLAPPDIGTTIHQGDILAKLDTILLDKQRAIALADIAEARAQLVEQQATLEQADNQRKRYEELVKTGGVSQTELDQAVRDQQVATAKIATAQAAIVARQADLDQTNERLGKMIVRAPFDGTITRKLTELGQWLSPGSPVAQLAEWSVVDARIDIPEAIIDAVKMNLPPQAEAERSAASGSAGSGGGPQITITVPSLNKTFTGRLYRVVPAGDPAARTFPALVRIDNTAGLLRPGMSVTAELTTAKNMDALTVARDAVQITPTGPRVIVDRNGTSAVEPVNILFAAGDRFVVRGAIKPGELLVIEGNERLVAGMPLKIVGEHEDANPQAKQTPESKP
ncbi:MAG: efflux RND transporter periplasmic adaptor subunit [Phycisphaerales bacterium]